VSHDIETSQGWLTRSPRRPLVAAVAFAASAVLALAGCSSSSKSSSSSSTASSSSASSAAPSSSTAAASSLFGPGCATLGLTDASVAAFASQPVATVAAATPFLKNVVAAATAGGIIDTLNAAPALTVFAPDDPAFAKEPAATLQALLTDPAQKPALIATLEYHVIGSELTKAQLAGSHPSLQGGALTIAGSGDNFTINGSANILCGPVKTKNAYVYIIDSVLHPAS
jgi:uncharacterized surface protein with fasciclin (FAS1) repeats